MHIYHSKSTYIYIYAFLSYILYPREKLFSGHFSMFETVTEDVLTETILIVVFYYCSIIVVHLVMLKN